MRYLLFVACSIILLSMESCKKDDPKPVPQILGFSPGSGIAGQQIVINGNNFNVDASLNTVKFNGVVAPVLTASKTKITATVPLDATTGKITVAVDGEIGQSAKDFIVLPSPKITTFTPSAGAVGATVTITGSNFNTTPSINVVKFNGVQTSVSSATATQLVVQVPNGATSGKISLELNGVSISSASDFAVLGTPSITNFNPASGAVGATVTITGSNFNTTPSLNVVKFNGVLASVSSATATQLVVQVPNGASSGKISLNLNGVVINSASDFTILFPPTITSFSPTNGSAGSVVTIIGTNFSTTAVDNVVKFNGISANVNSASATQLVVTVPANVTTGKVSVAVNGLTVLSSADFVKFACGVDQWVDVRDGKLYYTVLIGSQCWMAQNLNHGTFINSSTVQSNNGTIEKYGYNNTDDTNQWGAIYLWDEAMQYSTTPSARGVCPSSWHIPSDSEWKTLEISLGMSQVTADLLEWRGTDQGTQLRGNSGFGSVHSGWFENPAFQLRGNSVFYWTSTQHDGSTSLNRELWDGSPLVRRSTQTKGRGLYVRCLKD